MAQKHGKILIARGLQFGYVKIPAEIEAIPQGILNDRQKRECGRINGFGKDGDYESDSTLAKYYGVSRRTIWEDHRQIERLRLVVWMKVKGKPTCYWLRCNPKLQAEKYLEYDNKRMANPAYTCEAHFTGGVKPTSQVPVKSTSHNYYKINKTISAASPSPAEVRAQRLKEEEERRLAKLDTAIRAEWKKVLPPVRRDDWAEHKRRAGVMSLLNEQVIEGIESGLSVAEAVQRAYNENLELVNGGKRQ